MQIEAGVEAEEEVGPGSGAKTEAGVEAEVGAEAEVEADEEEVIVEAKTPRLELMHAAVCGPRAGARWYRSRGHGAGRSGGRRRGRLARPPRG